MRLGEIARLTDRLKSLGFSGTLNTAFVERINLTLRHALAALSRRSWATVQLTSELLAHLEWWRAYYHFLPSALVAAAPTRYAVSAAGKANVCLKHKRSDRLSFDGHI
jgi:hypothetical protein